MDQQYCTEQNISHPPGAKFCHSCGAPLAPKPAAEPRWGVYVFNAEMRITQEVEDNVHATAASAVAAAIQAYPDLAQSPRPLFVALVGPGTRLHDKRPLTFDSASRQSVIGNTVAHEQYLDVTYLEDA